MLASAQFRLSGGSSNSNPAASLGGVMSSVAVNWATLFDDASASEASVGDVEYRWVYVLNTGDKVLGPNKLFVSNQPTVGLIAVAVNDSGVDTDAEVLANEGTAPTGETFSAPANSGTGITVPNLNPGQRIAICVRRTITAGSPGIDANTTGNDYAVNVDLEHLP